MPRYHQEFLPTPLLYDVIKCFWYDSKDYGKEQTSFEVMPDGYAEIIFHFGNNLLRKEDAQVLPSPFIMGLLNQPAVFYTKDRLQIIGIRCYPWTVFDLLRIPSGKEKIHLLKHPIAQLQHTLEQLVHADEIEEAVAKVEQYFLELHSRIAAGSILFKAGAAMREAKGTLPVSKVASAAHATIRTLERNFKQAAGHTVKDVSALMRFEQVRNELWTHPDTNLAGLAHELGYTDQSHLSREFKRYSGTTPAAFARKAKKDHASSGDFVAFVQS